MRVLLSCLPYLGLLVVLVVVEWATWRACRWGNRVDKEESRNG